MRQSSLNGEKFGTMNNITHSEFIPQKVLITPTRITNNFYHTENTIKNTINADRVKIKKVLMYKLILLDNHLREAPF